MSELDAKTVARFWAKVDKSGPVPPHCPELGQCWVWTAALRGHGWYPAFNINGRMWKGNRVAFIIQNGDIAEGMGVCHKCDNPVCVRGSHLFQATHRDNMGDALAKGRFVIQPNPSKPGDLANRKKLTEAKVAEIRRLYPSLTQKDLAARFCVSKSTICEALSGNNWGTVAGARKPVRLVGSKVRTSKLTEQAVIEMRANYTGTWAEVESLSEKYKVGKTAIYKAVNKLTWKHAGDYSPDSRQSSSGS